MMRKMAASSYHTSSRLTAREEQPILSVVPSSKIQMISSDHPLAINCDQVQGL